MFLDYLGNRRILEYLENRSHLIHLEDPDYLGNLEYLEYRHHQYQEVLECLGNLEFLDNLAGCALKGRASLRSTQVTLSA